MIPLERFKEPAKELLPTPVERNWAAVVTLPVAWRPRPRFREPAKELDAVADRERKRLAETSVAEWTPKVVFKLPAKELEPTELPVKVPVRVVLPVTPRVEPRVVAPEILAVPKTSKLLETLAVPGMIKVLGKERVKLPLAPPSVAVI